MDVKSAMDAFLADPSEANEKNLIACLKKAEFFAPIVAAAPLAKPDGNAFYEEEGSNIKFALLEDEDTNEKFFPAFTGRDEMIKWRADSEQEAINLRLKDYAAMLGGKKNECAGVVIDVYSHALRLDGNFFKALFD